MKGNRRKIKTPLEELSYQRWVLRNKIKDELNKSDSIEKCDTLIQLTGEFQDIAKKLLEGGINTRTNPPALYEPTYWRQKYIELQGTFQSTSCGNEQTTTKTTKTQQNTTVKVKPTKSKSKSCAKNKSTTSGNKPQQNTISNNIYNIMLCWTTKVDYCVCDSIINAVRDYLLKMKLEKVDNHTTTFIDKIEYCEVYQITTTKDIYEIILNSTQYILDISSDSIYDKCNVGVFGKEIKI